MSPTTKSQLRHWRDRRRGPDHSCRAASTARIETIIDAARALGHVDASVVNPARWKGHLDHLLPSPKKVGKPRGHHAAMPYAEVPALMAQLAEIDSDASWALQLTILTGSRADETLGMPWDEIDFDKAIWSIPASRMKMGKAA